MTDETATDITEEVDVQPVPDVRRTPDMVTLFMRRSRDEVLGREDTNANLDYGPASRSEADHGVRNITFYNRYAVGVSADHPLLDEVLTKYPAEIVTTEEKSTLYMDPDTGKEYKSKRAYNAAQRAKKNKRTS